MSATVCASSPETAHSLLCLYSKAASQRGELEAFIRQRYAVIYQADIRHFLPFILATCQSALFQGALGLRPGAHSAFFVENYLDATIEDVITQQQGVAVPRELIIETGNLAGSRGSSQLLFVVLTDVLYKAGFRWITFTATPVVGGLLRRLGFAPQFVCEADVSRLGEQAKAWGSYYDCRPSVVVGNIEQAYLTLQNNELAQKLLLEYHAQIGALVATLEQAREGVAL